MIRRILFISVFLFFLLFLTGCTSSFDPASNPINPNNGFWDRYFVYPLSATLDWFAALLWGQYGLSILVVTLIIRLAILPLTLKQTKNSKQMQLLQPELKKLKEKYKDDARKQQEETMKLFQKHNVNPLNGCLPLLIQMPILLGLYHAIMRNSEISQHTFLGMQLGEPNVWVLPALAAITTYVQQKMMASQMPAQMQSLMFIFPILIFVMAIQFPSALALYWVYSNLFTIVQTYFIYGGSQSRGVQSK